MFSPQYSFGVPQDGATVLPCKTAGPVTDYFGLRVASIFVILVGSALGALVPIWLARTSRIRVPTAFFFAIRHFGSGVILATAWMHLLSPASDNLRDPCLAHVLPDYDWAMGIALATVMVMFLVEIIVSRFDFGDAHEQAAPRRGRSRDEEEAKASNRDASADTDMAASASSPPADDFLPGADRQLGLGHEHVAVVESVAHVDYSAQMTALSILEFGVILHSVFIGLTLAVSNNFPVLFVVLVFHQTFEGLGLGARLAAATWPADDSRRRWTPYVLGAMYAVSTPLAIAVGLAVRESLAIDPAASLVVNGVFDAVSGGILMYTGLVELLAHEFLFNPAMRDAGLPKQLAAYACVAAGVALMSLLAKWV